MKLNQIVFLIPLIFVFSGCQKMQTSELSSSPIPETSAIQSIDNPPASPASSKTLYLSKFDTNRQQVKIYAIDNASNQNKLKTTITIPSSLGSVGCSSFNGSYSICKNAVWVSGDGSNAIVETDHQCAGDCFGFGESWYSWSYVDLKSGKLISLYKSDVNLVDWQYDDKNQIVYITTQVPTNENKPASKKYFRIDVANKKIIEILAPYPNFFIDYNKLFTLSADHQHIQYPFGGKVIDTKISLPSTSNILGITWGI